LKPVNSHFKGLQTLAESKTYEPLPFVTLGVEGCGWNSNHGARFYQMVAEGNIVTYAEGGVVGKDKIGPFWAGNVESN
jgi:hypothetical protein